MSNLLIAAVALHKATGGTASITTPSGWSALAASGSGGSPFMGLYINTAPTLGSTAQSFVVANAAGIVTGGIITEFRGLGGIAGTADGLVATGTGTTGTSHTATGGTPAAGSEIALCALAIDSTGTGSGLTSSVIPAGWNLAGSQPDTLNTNGLAVYLYWTVGPSTPTAPSAALSWTTTGATPAYSTIITSLK